MKTRIFIISSLVIGLGLALYTSGALAQRLETIVSHAHMTSTMDPTLVGSYNTPMSLTVMLVDYEW